MKRGSVISEFIGHISTFFFIIGIVAIFYGLYELSSPELVSLNDIDSPLDADVLFLTWLRSSLEGTDLTVGEAMSALSASAQQGLEASYYEDIERSAHAYFKPLSDVQYKILFDNPNLPSIQGRTASQSTPAINGVVKSCVLIPTQQTPFTVQLLAVHTLADAFDRDAFERTSKVRCNE